MTLDEYLEKKARGVVRYRLSVVHANTALEYYLVVNTLLKNSEGDLVEVITKLEVSDLDAADFIQCKGLDRLDIMLGYLDEGLREAVHAEVKKGYLPPASLGAFI